MTDATTPAAETYRVLSFRQPYASLIVAGRKWCENRTWPTNHRGVLLVHASSRVEQEGIDDWPDELEAAGLDPRSLPTSGIIGAVWLVDCLPYDDLVARFQNVDIETVRTDPLRRTVVRQLRRLPETIDYMEGPECWVFSAWYQFEEPIPVKGKLNLWKYDLPAGIIPDDWLERAAATMNVHDPPR